MSGLGLFLIVPGLILVLLSTEVSCHRKGRHGNLSCKNGQKSGICKPMPECPTAKQAVRNFGYHEFERCGFDGDVEVVCCPSSDFRTVQVTETTTENVWTDEPPVKGTTTTKRTSEHLADTRGSSARKSAQECAKYSTDASISVGYYITEGVNAEMGEFPHMAAIGYETDQPSVIQFRCGGSLISMRYVVTAAHCVISVERRVPVVVRLGSINVPETVTSLADNDYNVTNITVHPSYNWAGKLNDIALLRLADAVKTSKNVYPACLYFSDDDPVGLVITGWGVTALIGDRSNILQKAKLRPVPLKECNITYATLTSSKSQRNILGSQICAMDNKSDACLGDSGGPLQVQRTQKSSIYSIVGVTSYGIGCGSNKYPGIYTRVYSYLEWIENIVWGDSNLL